MTQGNIYLDFNATTPVDPLVQAKLPEWVTLWGNPSSIHFHGRAAKKILRESRRRIAASLGVHPLEIVFTSGGSEANNLAIKGHLAAIKAKQTSRHRVIFGAIEHPSVLKQAEAIEEMGFVVSILPVDLDKAYDLKLFKSLLGDDVALVSVMLANNEVGYLAPIAEMVALTHKAGAVFHSDMVQAIGKTTFDLKNLDVDLASFSSHKLYALKGSGALYIKRGTALKRLIDGGSQERARRAGTENLLAIASFAEMVDSRDETLFAEQIGSLRDHLEKRLIKEIKGVRLLGKDCPRLPNTSCFLVDGVSGETMLMNLDIKGFSVGTGAACSSGNPEPSPVLLALGLSAEQAQTSLRVSLGKTTTIAEINHFVETLKVVVSHIRQLEMDYVENF